MDADWSTFLSRDEVLGGLPARRASTLLFAIESRTAHIVAHSRRAMATYVTEKTAEEGERAFLDALAQGREPPDSGVRAALARMISEKYSLPKDHALALRRALGLDGEEVQQTFERLHGQPLESIYSAQLAWRERLRWARSRLAKGLETLPPFWTAFALTLTETVGAGILALPIAVAKIGPIGGLVVILVLGIVNMVTIAAIAEAVARNGNVRYGHAYFGRVVGDYLGNPGKWLLIPAQVLFSVANLLAYYVGLSTTLADVTKIPSEVWTALMFVAALGFLRRESLDATVASALLVGVTSITLILILSLVTLPHVTGVNLRHSNVPFVNGQPFDASLLKLVFGVVLGAYFGHTSLGNCASVVLQRDPGARSFIRGSVAGLSVAALLYSAWVLSVNGAVSPVALAGEMGTALQPLSDEVGASVTVFGSVFAVLAMGMASIHVSFGLFNQTREWLPVRQGETNRERRFWLGVLPVAAVFVGVEGLMLADRASFAGPFGFLGTIAVPMLAGIFPMLMVVASRRKGDCALDPVWKFVGHPLLAAAISLFFLSALLLHGLFIWDEFYERVPAFLAFGATVLVGAIAIRRGAFKPRTVVELRVESDPRQSTVVNVVSAGRSISAEIHLAYRDVDFARRTRPNGNPKAGELRSAMVTLPPSEVGELKVWVHQMTPDGTSEKLPAVLMLRNGAGDHEYNLASTGEKVIVDISGESQRLEILLHGI